MDKIKKQYASEKRRIETSCNEEEYIDFIVAGSEPLRLRFPRLLVDEWLERMDEVYETSVGIYSDTSVDLCTAIGYWDAIDNFHVCSLCQKEIVTAAFQLCPECQKFSEQYHYYMEADHREMPIFPNERIVIHKGVRYYVGIKE